MSREMKLGKKRLCLFWVMVCLVLANSLNVSAAGKNQKALRAYKSILQKNRVAYDMKPKEFALIDINRDGVKEMLVRESVYSSILIYTYNGKRAVLVGRDWTWQSSGVGYNTKTHYLTFYRAMTVGYDVISYVTITKTGKIKRYVYTQKYDGNQFYYDINGKKASKNKFFKRSKYEDNTHGKGVRFYKNGKTNRGKMKSLKSYN